LELALRRKFSIERNQLEAKIQIPGGLKAVIIDPRILFLKVID